MSLKRVLLAAALGALTGGGSAIALVQSGQLASSTSSVAVSAGVAAVFSALAAALARFRIVRVLLILAAIALSVFTFFLAQTPVADALAVQRDQCASARIGEATVDGNPLPGALGSAQRPVRIAVDGDSGVTIEIQTNQSFTKVTIEATIVEPVDIQRTVRLSDDIRIEDGRATRVLDIVETRTGLSVRVGDQTVPLPFGTARIEGSFTEPESRRAQVDECSFVLHVQLVTSAFDTLAGRIALGAVAVGALGLVVIALTSAGAGGATAGGSGVGAGARPPTPRPPTQRPPPARPAPAPPARPAPAPPAQPAPAPPAQPAPAPPTQPAPAPPAQPAPAPPAPPAQPAPAPPAPAPPAPAPAPVPPAPAPAPPVVTGPVAAAGGVIGAIKIPPEPAPPTTGRFVQMRIEADHFPEQGFVAGTTNKLSFWIGPEIVDDYVQRASHAVAEAGRTITLDAQFVWPDGEATGTMTLDADTSTRSDPKFEVDVAIPVDATRFGGTLYLWVRETNRLYEQVKVVGAVAASGHVDRPHLISIVEDRDQIDRIDEGSPAVGACVVHEGNTLFWYTNAEPSIRDATDVMVVEANLASAVANLQARAGQIDWVDPASLALLRRIAVEGAKLRYAVAGEIEPGPALQFYNQQDKSTVPFEWVYDRGYTAADAIVKPTCIASLRQPLPASRSIDDPFPCGCPPASALSSDMRFSNPTLCPWGFWGLAKVIERYDTEPTLVNNVPHPDADALLPQFSSVLLAANNTLDVASGRPGEAPIDLTGALAATVATTRVHTWVDFRSALADGDAHLIVTLPHQDTDTLQIGTDELHLSQVPALLDEGHERVILLLGCKTTQVASTGFASFGRVFKDHAAVVVGSSATLVTSDAARIAIKLVEQLALVAATGEPLGNAVITARQQLFADGYPIALAVTALGDADWRFAIKILERV